MATTKEDRMSEQVAASPYSDGNEAAIHLTRARRRLENSPELRSASVRKALRAIDAAMSALADGRFGPGQGPEEDAMKAMTDVTGQRMHITNATAQSRDGLVHVVAAGGSPNATACGSHFASAMGVMDVAPDEVCAACRAALGEAITVGRLRFEATESGLEVWLAAEEAQVRVAEVAPDNALRLFAFLRAACGSPESAADRSRERIRTAARIVIERVAPDSLDELAEDALADLEQALDEEVA